MANTNYCFIKTFKHKKKKMFLLIKLRGYLISKTTENIKFINEQSLK